MIRVMVALMIWVTVMFGPFLLLLQVNFPFWGTIWLLLAAAGSYWGFYYLTKKRKAITSERILVQVA